MPAARKQPSPLSLVSPLGTSPTPAHSVHKSTRRPPRLEAALRTAARPAAAPLADRAPPLSRSSSRPARARPRLRLGAARAPMSFNFEWPQFSDDFYADAREMLAQVSPVFPSLISSRRVRHGAGAGTPEAAVGTIQHGLRSSTACPELLMLTPTLPLLLVPPSASSRAGAQQGPEAADHRRPHRGQGAQHGHHCPSRPPPLPHA